MEPNYILRGYRYRLYVTPEQASYLAMVVGCVRFVYNIALAQRKWFGRTGRWFSYEAQNKELTALKAEAEFLKDMPSQALQEALRDLHVAYQNWFAKRTGYPSPRRKGLNDSFRIPEPKSIRLTHVEDEKYASLVLPKFGVRKTDHGALKLRYHRPIEGDVRSATVSCEAGVWYVSILCRVRREAVATPTGDVIGIDCGVAVPLCLSNGEMPYAPITTARGRERSKRIQQRISRCKRGSANRRKAVKALGRRKAKEARRRRDALHKASTHLAKNHYLIGIEDLRIKNMTRSAVGTKNKPGKLVRQKSGLNRAVLDVGWGMFASMLEYKCDWYGSSVIRVPPMHSSQECSACGHVNALNRVSRDLFRCTSCNHTAHADVNAAMVIRDRALDLYLSTPEDTYSGSACGALCAKQGDEAGNKSRKARSLVLQGEE